MLSRSELALAVRHADVAMHHAFVFSEPFFYGVEPGAYWLDRRVLAESSNPIELDRRAFVVVEGDLMAPCSLMQGGVLIVLGACRSVIRAREHSEVILARGLDAGATLTADGITHVFAGGDVRGELDLRGSGKVWIEGSLLGSVRTGKPLTELSIRGDCPGAIEPGADKAMLMLHVDGFMDSERIEAIAAQGYVLFHASIGTSNRPAGLYPELARNEATLRESRQNRWVIRRVADRRT